MATTKTASHLFRHAASRGPHPTRLTLPRSSLFHARYVPILNPRLHSYHAFDKNYILAPLALRRALAKKEADPAVLWWQVRVPAGSGPLAMKKKVVRARAARRVKMAFRTALADKGYDIEGRRKVVQEDGVGEAGLRQALVGGLVVLAGRVVLDAEWVTLKKDCAALVEGLERLSLRGESGN